MDQGAAWVSLHQPMVYRVEVLRFLPDRLSRPLGLLMSSRCSSSNRISMVAAQGGAMKVSTMTDMGRTV